MLEFKSNGHLTLGVEIELQLLDKETLDLKPAAIDVLRHTVSDQNIKPEIFQSMVEINTGICADVAAVEKDLRGSMAVLKEAAHQENALLSTTGTHPFARYSERLLFPAERYDYLIDRNQWIAQRLMIFGMHIHIGMRDGESCIRFNNFFLRFIPHLLALTASSPFWQGGETGLASCRPTIFESCPTAGHPCRLQNWQEFSDLCDRMVKSQSIGDLKDIWWDLRPSPRYGTLEIRACDGVATLQETLAVVAFVHTLAHWFDTHDEFDRETPPPPLWIMRENKWRAMRHGMEALIIKNNETDVVPLREHILLWIDRLSPVAKSLGYDAYWKSLAELVERGSSYRRQIAVFEKTGSVMDVTRHNCTEFEQEAPAYS